MPVEIKPKSTAQVTTGPPGVTAVATDSNPAVATVGEPITVPNVEASPVQVAGVEPVVTEGAEFEVMHMIVGAFDHGSYRPGDRIKGSDLGETANIERLVKLEALKPLADAPAPQSETGKAKK